MQMTHHITIREFARLKIGSVVKQSLDFAEISLNDFNYLSKLDDQLQYANPNQSIGNKSKVFSFIDRETIKAENFVGVIRTPFGTTIEILPKITQVETVWESKNILFDMILVSQGISPKYLNEANLKSKDKSLSDWVVSIFISELEKLIRRGIKQDYFDLEEEQYFLRGKLDFNKYIQNIGGKKNIFPIRHNSFGFNNAENRLLKSALEHIVKMTADANKLRISNKYLSLMDEIPFSLNIKEDFNKWRKERLLMHYSAIRPLCELILMQKNPLATHGIDEGVSLLFPMERLFESYVRKYLGDDLKNSFVLGKKVTYKYLMKQKENSLFRLKPDFVVQHDGVDVLVLDAKWKTLSVDSKKYGISEKDLYQMYVYSHVYLNFKGHILLIYPATEKFKEPLEPFKFIPYNNAPSLLVVPFDLKSKKILWDQDKCHEVANFFNM